ncbi:GAF domain-containing sensor histidine kinase [Virgisporangium ochraceum]|nr:GAF domain-containing sensor histidine kinase [Virgisporangium ochraceum]
MVAALALTALRRPGPVPAAELVQALGFAGFPAMAVLLTARRADPRYAVPWSTAALGWSVVMVAGAGPALPLLGTLGDLGWCVAVTSTPFLLLLFPDGRVPAPRWRVLPPVVLAAGAAACVGTLMTPGPAGTGPVDRWTVLGGRLGPVGEPLLFASVLVLLVAVLAAIASLVVRYRSGSTPVRLQITWVAFAALSLGVPFAVLGLANVAVPGVWGALLLAVPMLATCAAVAVAVLRHRLYDIDVIIRRTVVYGLLTAAVVAGYVTVVGTLSALLQGRARWPVAVVATGLVAVAFQPARERLQRAVNRLLYGDRDEPHEVVARLADRLATTPEPAAMLPTVVDTTAQALRLPHVSIWQVDGDVLRPAATTGGTAGPETGVVDAAAADLIRAATEPLPRIGGDLGAALDAAGVTLVLPLRHAGDLVGVLCAAPRRRGEDWSDPDRRALTQLARHAGAVVHADRLTAALRRSLGDLTRSRDGERRRIQRDLHDGLGPTLAAIRLHVETCLDAGTAAPEWLRRELERIDELVGQAGSDVRRLVHGLHPPTLDQLGLVAALDRQVTQFGRDTGMTTRFTGEAVGDTPAAVGITVYRVTQEALTNVAKHSGAASVDVALWHHDSHLHLRVDDDGAGLRPGAGGGAGLGGMRDRAASVGGTLTLDRRPGGGTRLTLTVPNAAEP